MTNFKKLLIGLTIASGNALPIMACTGISLTAKDGSFVHARTIEWAAGFVPCDYVIIPRGQALTSYTPIGSNGVQFSARHGVVGCSVAQKEFIVEGINEAGLAAGLFYFADYGEYAEFDSTLSSKTLADLQVVPWILSQFSTIDEVKAAIGNVRIVSLDPKVASTVHWRISQPDGRQVVLEILDGGVPHFYENKVGVITNSPGFPWQVTNLNNYVNLYPGDAPTNRLGEVTLKHIGGSSGMLGLPGDFTSPSRFVRAAFLRNTAPQQADAFSTVTLCFHLLNNFDVPIGLEHPIGKAPDLPSATQWTTATDLTNRRIYYKTAYNNTIRCIDLNTIDFTRTAYQVHPMDTKRVQPVEVIYVK
ncbi:MAG: choloylglycine hydrolase family protein [Bacteroidaceae bacterium]|nr:choloylglycine hydrolase family protein [Bacteroidaceae bacterium]